MRKIFLWTLIVVCFGAWGCTKKSSHPDFYGSVKPKHPANELWVNGASEPQFMDPAKISGQAGSEVARNMFVRLTQQHPKTAQPLPDLAYKWDISSDGKKYLFYLRHDAQWSDGKPLTAHDVAWSWKRVLAPQTASPYASLLDVVQYAKAYRDKAILVQTQTCTNLLENLKEKIQKAHVEKGPIKGCLVSHKHADLENFQKDRETLKTYLTENNLLFEAVTEDFVAIKALDDHRLEVVLQAPVPYFLGLIEYIVFAPVPKHVIEAVTKETGNEDFWLRPEHIVVSGPFKLIKEEFKQYKIFEKNPLYYYADQVRIDKVKSLLIEDYTADLQAYQTGQFEWSCCNSIPSEMLERVSQYKDFHTHPIYAIYNLAFNVNKKPFDDKRVRKALSLAIDRQSLVDNITKSGQVPSYNYVPPSPGYQGPFHELYNIERAQTLLEQAGFPKGEGFPKATLKFNTSEGHRKVAEAVQQMWKKNLNIDIELTNVEWKIYLDDMDQGNYEIIRRGWIADYVDPHAFLVMGTTGNGNNRTGWSNPIYDNLIQRSDLETDPQKRNQLFYQAEEILNEEQFFLPLYVYTRSYMKKPYLKGVWPSLGDVHEWKHMWIDERYYKEVPETEQDEKSWIFTVTYQEPSKGKSL